MFHSALLRLAYLVGFGLAGAACLLSLRGVSKVAGPDARRGLFALLLLSGAWALTHVGWLISADYTVGVTFYTLGLVVGLATVGAWLYFCSAYTGNDYHRRRAVRLTAVVAYAAIVAVKLTNGLHGWYFVASVTAEPFRHVGIQLDLFHWIVTGLAYSASAVGFYLLYDMLDQSHSDPWTLGLPIAATAAPVVIYLLSFGTSSVVTLHYEPLGVAVFAVATLYVVDEEFVAVPRFWRNQVIETINDVVVLLGPDGEIRDTNRAAVEAFPQFQGAVGQTLDRTVPELAETATTDGGVVSVEREDGGTKYYLLDRTTLTSGDLEVGQAIVCTDVTRVERQRRELRRQNDQFDDFAEAITHELRNTLTIADGYLDLVAGRVEDTDEDDELAAATEQVGAALDRMNRIVDDLSTLAQYGQTLDEVGTVSLDEAVRAAEASADTDVVTVEVGGDDVTLAAEESRLVQLFRTAIEFTALYGSTRLLVEPTDSGFAMVVDGPPLPPGQVESAFEYGEAVPSAETGMLLPTIDTLSRVHGWTVDVDRSYTDGVRLKITGPDFGDSGLDTDADTDPDTGPGADSATAPESGAGTEPATDAGDDAEADTDTATS